MGVRMVRFGFVPGENEQLEVVVKLPEEPRSMIHGIVKDSCDRVVKNAVVKLFKVENPHNPCSVKPLTHNFTDDCGQFMFGPLCPHTKYVIKVWVDDVKIRELVVRPEDCDDWECKKDGFEEEEK